MLSQSRLKEIASYDPATGIFVRIKKQRGLGRVGDVMGCKNSAGYYRICIDGKSYLNHRLAWLYVHGRWPREELDHINGDPTDNSLGNLREATRLENQRNTGLSRRNASGFKGAFFNKQYNKWLATITVRKKMRIIGKFDTREAAHAAYCAEARHVFGDFARAS